MMKRCAELPLELWDVVIDLNVVTYFDELWTRVLDVRRPGQESPSSLNPVKSLLRVSFRFRHETLKILSEVLGIPYKNAGVGHLDGDPREPIDAVQRLWYPIDLEKQNHEVEKLAERSEALGVYAHLVATMQQSCSLLALTVEARNDNGSICPEAALERQPAAETLRASARDHYIPAVYAVMAPGVKRRPFPRRRIVLLVMHFALSIAGAARTLHWYNVECLQLASVKDVAPEDVPYTTHPGRYEHAVDVVCKSMRKVPQLYRDVRDIYCPGQLLETLDLLIGQHNLAMASRMFANAMTSLPGPTDIYEHTRARSKECKELVDALLMAQSS